MKSIPAACLLVILPAMALAQTAPPPDSSTKEKPVDPIVASEHSGPGRVGIRLNFDKVTGMPQIISMTRGGAAADAGFKVGDIIVKINRNYTNTLTEEECRLALHGDPGTGVELTVYRGDDPKAIVRAIERRVPAPYSDDLLERIVVEAQP